MKRKTGILIILIFAFFNGSAQYYDSAYIDSINSFRLASEGDLYLDTINQRYFIGLTHGTVTRIGEDSASKFIDTLFVSGDTLFIEEGKNTQQVVLSYIPTYLCKEEVGVTLSYRLQNKGNLYINESDTSEKKTYQELLDSNFKTCESLQNVLELTGCKRREFLSDSSSAVIYVNDSVDVYDRNGDIISFGDYSEWFPSSGLSVLRVLNCYDEFCFQIGNIQYIDYNGNNIFQNLNDPLDERSLNSLIDSSAVACAPVVCQQVYSPSDFGINIVSGLPDSNPQCLDLSATWYNDSTGEIFNWNVDSLKWVILPPVTSVSCPQAAISSVGGILSSVGVSSVTSQGTGRYTVNLSVPQQNTNYVVLLSKNEGDGTGARDDINIDVVEGSKTQTSFRVIIHEGDNSSTANTYRSRNWYFSIPCQENSLISAASEDTIVSTDADNILEEGVDGGAYLRNVACDVFNSVVSATEFCTGVEQKVVLADIAYNRGGFSLSNNEITIPVAGDYRITYSVSVTSDNNEYSARMRLAINNIPLARSTSYAHARNNSSSGTATRTVLVTLAENDTVDIRQIRSLSQGANDNALRIRQEGSGLLIERISP